MDAEALDDPCAAGVEHVDEGVVEADAGRELASGRQHLCQLEPVAVHAEHRDRVAARVDGDQQVVAPREGE